jgi:hypothetical protein
LKSISQLAVRQTAVCKVRSFHSKLILDWLHLGRHAYRNMENGAKNNPSNYCSHLDISMYQGYANAKNHQSAKMELQQHPDFPNIK